MFDEQKGEQKNMSKQALNNALEKHHMALVPRAWPRYRYQQEQITI